MIEDMDTKGLTKSLIARKIPAAENIAVRTIANKMDLIKKTFCEVEIMASTRFIGVPTKIIPIILLFSSKIGS